MQVRSLLPGTVTIPQKLSDLVPQNRSRKRPRDKVTFCTQVEPLTEETAHPEDAQSHIDRLPEVLLNTEVMFGGSLVSLPASFPPPYLELCIRVLAVSCLAEEGCQSGQTFTFYDVPAAPRGIYRLLLVVP